MTVPPDIAKMSFEAALAELEGIVKKLEAGEGKLEEAIKAYERGTALKSHCEAKLREAQAKIDQIIVSPDGAVGSKRADIG